MPRHPAARMPPVPAGTPDIDDDFSSSEISGVWIAHYLPHWTTPDRSAARMRFSAEGLELRIDDDQPDWRPEDTPLRVSNLQTATYSGDEGSNPGTHRHRADGLVVRTPSPTRLL